MVKEYDVSKTNCRKCGGTLYYSGVMCTCQKYGCGCKKEEGKKLCPKHHRN
jgi:surface antigen